MSGERKKTLPVVILSFLQNTVPGTRFCTDRGEPGPRKGTVVCEYERITTKTGCLGIITAIRHTHALPGSILSFLRSTDSEALRFD